MANVQIGEVEIELGGKTYTIKPSFRALVEIEEKSGQACLTIAEGISKGLIPVKTLVAILYGGLVGAGVKDLTFDQVGEFVIEGGMNRYVQPAATFLARGLMANPEKKTTDQ
jgi:hypothetical protein